MGAGSVGLGGPAHADGDRGGVRLVAGPHHDRPGAGRGLHGEVEVLHPTLPGDGLAEAAQAVATGLGLAPVGVAELEPRRRRPEPHEAVGADAEVAVAQAGAPGRRRAVQRSASSSSTRKSLPEPVVLGQSHRRQSPSASGGRLPVSHQWTRGSRRNQRSWRRANCRVRSDGVGHRPVEGAGRRRHGPGARGSRGPGRRCGTGAGASRLTSSRNPAATMAPHPLLDAPVEDVERGRRPICTTGDGG